MASAPSNSKPEASGQPGSGLSAVALPPTHAEVSAALIFQDFQMPEYRSNDFRILLQKTDTLEFLQNDGGWKSDRDNAFAFESAAKAADYAEVGNFQNIQIAYSFGSADQDLAFPLV